MILFHGTNIQFDKINLGKCKPNKDFGKGFYLTPLQKRAKERAKDKCDKELFGTPIVIAYEFDEKELDTLSIKTFEETNTEWLEFILQNRDRKTSASHSYDIVIGPVADDGVITSISLYEAKVIDKETLIKRLTYAKPYIQYCFCTQKAVNLLKKI